MVDYWALVFYFKILFYKTYDKLLEYSTNIKLAVPYLFGLKHVTEKSVYKLYFPLVWFPISFNNNENNIYILKSSLKLDFQSIVAENRKSRILRNKYDNSKAKEN